MLDDVIIRAALAGLGVAIVASPLGCFVVWRRMAYFGDATAHSALLGVALSLAFSVSIFAGVTLLALLVAVLISFLNRRGHHMDTLLGVLAHGGLATGLVVMALVAPEQDLDAYLFGDILGITLIEIWIIWVVAAVVLSGLVWRWSGLLTSTLNDEMAYAGGIDPHREQLVFILALALVVAVGLKLVGALLIGAMLIIPAAAARPWVRSPEAMAVLATCIGVVSVFLGLGAAYYYETPPGPTMVCFVVGFFMLSIIPACRR